MISEQKNLDITLHLLYNIVTVLHKTTMTVTTNDRGQQNMWATEPAMYMTEEDRQRYGLESHAERAEKMNGRWAMMGFAAAVISYATSGSVFFFGLFGF